MIVRRVWHDCTQHCGTSTHPKRCFFVGVSDEDLPKVLPLLDAFERAEFDEIDAKRRDDWYHVPDFSLDPVARLRGPRYWWFLVADDLSSAMSLPGIYPYSTMWDGNPPFRPYHAQVDDLGDLALLGEAQGG